MNDRRGLIAALCLAAATTACGAPREEGEASPAPVSVAAATVQRADMDEVLVATGELVAARTLNLASPVAGRITKLSLLPGDRVGSGDTVARVLPLESEAALHGLALLEDSGARVSARPLADIPLRAPFPAIVSGRSRNPGEQVSAGDALVELFDPSSLYVVAQVPADKVPLIVTGLPVEVVRGDDVWPGQVSAVVPTTTPESLTVPVRISVDEPIEPPVAGAAVRCRIEIAKHRNVLVVPRSALVSSTVTEKGKVLVDEGGRANERSVRLGLRTTDRVEVVDGLQEGEVVLSDGHYSLPDGALIQTRPAE